MTVTVKVWSGPRYVSYAQLLHCEPEEYEIEVTDGYLPHEEHVMLAHNIENHSKYVFDVETDEVVDLKVETNDSYHDPIGGFDEGRPVEGGLLYAPDGHNLSSEKPFKVEMWGRIRMRVEEYDE